MFLQYHQALPQTLEAPWKDMGTQAMGSWGGLVNTKVIMGNNDTSPLTMGTKMLSASLVNGKARITEPQRLEGDP